MKADRQTGWRIAQDGYATEAAGIGASHDMGADGLQVKVTRRHFLKGVGLLSASAALAACSLPGWADEQGAEAAEPSPMLAIIHTNDTHGHDVELASSKDVASNFSMAAVAALKHDWEARGYDVLLLDAGDATQGTPLVDTRKGSTAIAFMNSCGYDLMAVGNHEFDWGMDNMAAIEQQACFPLLSASVLMEDTGEPRFATSKTFDLTDGTRVGVFGLTTPATLTSANPKNLAGLTFLQGEELFACAQEQVDRLRGQGCDLVVCLGHLGNKPTCGISTSKALLEAVTGIDLFIDGHDHWEVEEEVGGTLLVETGCHLHNIGVVVIDNGAPANKPVPYGGYSGIDAATQAIIDAANEDVNEELGVVFGETPFLLNGERSFVRAQETNLGNFCADAFRWTAEEELGCTVDAGLINSGGIRASVEPGDISLKTLRTVLPYSNDLCVIKVTGAQLLEVLEAATQGIGGDHLIGGFPQVSGISFSVDASAAYEAGPLYPDSAYASPATPGARVRINDVGGRGFSLDETYALATITFLCEGGDTYYALKVASETEQPVPFAFDYEALASYLVVACDHVVPDEYAEPEGRITITGLE